MVTTISPVKIEAMSAHGEHSGNHAPQVPSRHRSPDILLREALGTALRTFRADSHLTLRQLADLARVSPGYLSELERGRKEVSSELLASVCRALGVSVADVLIEAAGTMAMVDAAAELEHV
ncbi:hypothetical protein HMPREF1219_00803 [Corynebacterium pyruviciproducens ATCC BAA-1742]|uniref:HTH cro/C1-type domain-containing protein n=2 Tax=Corynebacterium pyruviciproducens TaxID=598660 RepID=S2YZR0_9CORY|nr:hypothetical protein HMPREF1219_00803 [Corynebacterium pyruviciproducens ATCC BAA-1742]